MAGTLSLVRRVSTQASSPCRRKFPKTQRFVELLATPMRHPAAVPSNISSRTPANTVKPADNSLWCFSLSSSRGCQSNFFPRRSSRAWRTSKRSGEPTTRDQSDTSKGKPQAAKTLAQAWYSIHSVSRIRPSKSKIKALRVDFRGSFTTPVAGSGMGKRSFTTSANFAFGRHVAGPAPATDALMGGAGGHRHFVRPQSETVLGRRDGETDPADHKKLGQKIRIFVQDPQDFFAVNAQDDFGVIRMADQLGRPGFFELFADHGTNQIQQNFKIVLKDAVAPAGFKAGPCAEVHRFGRALAGRKLFPSFLGRKTEHGGGEPQQGLQNMVKSRLGRTATGISGAQGVEGVLVDIEGEAAQFARAKGLDAAESLVQLPSVHVRADTFDQDVQAAQQP